MRAILTMATNRIAICLLRNDLRYHDNEVLFRGHQNADFVLPLYCFDPRHFEGTWNFGFPKTGAFRTKFLVESVKDLRNTLQKHGSNLMIAHAKPEDTIAKLLQSFSATKVTVYLQSETTYEELHVEDAVTKSCKERKNEIVFAWGATLIHKSDLPFNIARVPDTYTEFRKAVETRSKIRPEISMPDKLKGPPVLPDNLQWGELPTYEQLKTENAQIRQDSAFPFGGGESEGLFRLSNYVWKTANVAKYKVTRNGLVGTEYSTKFSPWLALGCVSPRRIHWEIEKFENQKVKNDSTYWVRFELLWRDYFRFISLKYGDRMFYPSGLIGKRQVWKRDSKLFDAWRYGRTGVPFVDANMRELLHTGWMSNRGRQNVASFLVKDLKLDWRLGAEWFESQLLDHDVCSNYGNWNYVAGIGNDPREDRKFNMIKQAMDYDAEGIFVRQWIPELSKLPSSKVHMLWTLSNGELSAAGISLGETYPNPVVIAPEWSRHSARKDGPKNNVKGKNPGPMKNGQQRGIDFYFKNGSTRK